MGNMFGGQEIKRLKKDISNLENRQSQIIYKTEYITSEPQIIYKNSEPQIIYKTEYKTDPAL